MAMAHHVPPSPILRELEGSGWTHQLPTYGTGIPPTHHALSHEERQPKGLLLLPTLSCCGSAALPPQEGLQQQGQGLWVTGEVRAAAHLEPRVMGTQSGSGCQPCQVIQKVQSKALSVPVGGLHVCPQKPGLPRGFAWKMRVVLFVSEQGSSTCTRDFEMVQVRCRIWEAVMDRPGQEDGGNNQRSPLALCIPFQRPLQLLHPNPPTPFVVLWFFFCLFSLFLNPMEIKL